MDAFIYNSMCYPWTCLFTAVCTPYLGVSVLQQPVLPFDVSVLQQVVLPLDMSFLHVTALSLNYKCFCPTAALCCFWPCLSYCSLVLLLDVSVLQQPVLPLEVSVTSTEDLLPLNVSVLQHFVLPSSLCCPYM